MIEKNDDLKRRLVDSFENLISNPPQRAYLFRTRCERSLIGASSYADQIGDKTLKTLADNSRQKLIDAVDRSISMSDGTLRSYKILSEDIKQIITYLAA